MIGVVRNNEYLQEAAGNFSVGGIRLSLKPIERKRRY